MEIASIKHKGLRLLIEDNDPRLMPAEVVQKICTMISALESLTSADQLRHMPAWRAHPLSGNRANVWSLHVTANWRLTFVIDHGDSVIRELNFEDYH